MIYSPQEVREMEESLQNFEIQNFTIDVFKMLWSIKKAQPEGCINPVLDQELQTVIVKLETFGVNVEGLKF